MENMPNNVNIINLMNILNILDNGINNNNILNRSFNDQGGAKKSCSVSFINELKQVEITNEDVDNKLCCAICQDNFKMGEKVLKLPCQDPHYYHFESEAEVCEGILPWLKDNNSCPICREEFPEEPDNQKTSTPIEEGAEEGAEEAAEEAAGGDENPNHDPIQDINDIMHIMFTMMIPPNMPLTPNMTPTPNMLLPNIPTPNMPPPNIEMGNNMYIPMIIHNNYNEDEDPDLQEAIRQSLS